MRVCRRAKASLAYRRHGRGETRERRRARATSSLTVNSGHGIINIIHSYLPLTPLWDIDTGLVHIALFNDQIVGVITPLTAIHRW